MYYIIKECFEQIIQYITIRDAYIGIGFYEKQYKLHRKRSIKKI